MFASHRFALAVTSAIACLASTACAGQTGSGMPYAAPRLAAFDGNAFKRADAHSLLFVSDAGNNTVSVFTFPKGAPVRTLNAAFSDVYSYPKGGHPIFMIGGFSQPIGVVTVKAP